MLIIVCVSCGLCFLFRFRRSVFVCFVFVLFCLCQIITVDLVALAAVRKSRLQTARFVELFGEQQRRVAGGAGGARCANSAAIFLRAQNWFQVSRNSRHSLAGCRCAVALRARSQANNKWGDGSIYPTTVAQLKSATQGKDGTSRAQFSFVLRQKTDACLPRLHQIIRVRQAVCADAGLNCGSNYFFCLALVCRRAVSVGRQTAVASCDCGARAQQTGAGLRAFVRVCARLLPTYTPLRLCLCGMRAPRSDERLDADARRRYWRLD